MNDAIKTFDECWRTAGCPTNSHHAAFVGFLETWQTGPRPELLRQALHYTEAEFGEAVGRRILLENVPEQCWTPATLQAAWEGALVTRWGNVDRHFVRVPLCAATAALFWHVLEEYPAAFYWFVAHHEQLLPAKEAALSTEARALREALLTRFLRKVHWTGGRRWGPVPPMWTPEQLRLMEWNKRWRRGRVTRERGRRDWMRIERKTRVRKANGKRRLRIKEFRFNK